MRSLRIVVLGILALFALVLGGLAGFLWLAGPDAHRWVARRALETAFDREILVDGALEVELGAAPTLFLTHLRIDNPSWAAASTLLRVERAEIQIALRPLLRGNLVFPRFALEGVSIDLETATDGRHSWESDAPEFSAAAPQRRFAPALFGDFKVADATITHHDQRGGRRTEVRVAGLIEQRDASSGGMRLDVMGEINGNAFEIRGASGSLEAALAATAPYPIEIDLQLPAVTATLRGTIADAAGARGLDLKFDARSSSLRAAARAWNVDLPADAQVAASGRLDGDLAKLSLTDVAAEITTSAGDRFELGGNLGDVWERRELDAAATLKLQPHGGFGKILPESWRHLRGLEASARLAGSILTPTFEPFSAEFQGPGNSNLKLEGALELAFADGGGALDRLDMAATLAVPEPSAWGDHLGVDLAAFGALRGEARFFLADQWVETSDLTIEAPEFGALEVKAWGPLATRTLRLDPDMSFIAQMADSRPVLALIEAENPGLGALVAKGRVVRDERGFVVDQLELDLVKTSHMALHAAGKVGPLVTSDFGATELDLAVRVAGTANALLGPWFDGDLPALGMAKGAFGLLGTVADLRIEDAELATRRDDGVVISVTGEIEHIGMIGRPPEFDGVAFDLDAHAPSTTVAAQLFGHDLPDFGATHVRGQLGRRAGSFALIAIDSRTGPKDAPSIRMTGSVNDLLALEKVELAGFFEIPTVDLLALIDIHGNADLGVVRGKVALSDGDGSIGFEHLEAEVGETDLLAFTMNGLIDDLVNGDGIKLETHLDVKNITNLAAVYDVAAADLGRFRFDGKLSKYGRQLAADGSAILGETQLVGTLAGDFSAPRPSFKGHLSSPHLRLDDLGLKPGEDHAPTFKDGRKLFGTTPVPLDGLRLFDLDMEVQLDRLEGAALDVDQVKARAMLTDGHLNLSPLRFDIASGHAMVDADLDMRAPTPKWRLRAETDDVRLGDVWRQLETDVPLAGELDLVLDLQASGRSPYDLASSLDGDLSLALQRGQIASRLFDLTANNPIRSLLARSTRRGYSGINCFVVAFHAENGVAELDALVLDTPNMLAAGEGKIDFAREILDLRIQPRAKQSHLVDLATPFAIRGAFTNPSVEAGTIGATARALGRVAVSPVNFLGSLLPFVSDRGGDAENPCLTLSEPAAPKS